MPELPEVETTRCGITPHLLHKTIEKMVIRDTRLRWPMQKSWARAIKGLEILSIERRAKYLLLNTAKGTLLIHLGMSGSLRIASCPEPAEKHQHFDIIMQDGTTLQYRDPRRFGCCLWLSEDPYQHKLLTNLGPEPLSRQFNTKYLLAKCANSQQNIKQRIMDSKIVVGVGNIYASEALYDANIHPLTPANLLNQSMAQKLCQTIKKVLQKAIKAGGTTLQDFTNGDGQPGYFQQKLKVYGRAEQPCLQCQTPISSQVIAQRNTFFCSNCQLLPTT